MAKSFDYSKWDKIELSDDESDCHPNIDKQSWFRMKHRTRLEREEKEDVEVKGYEQGNKEATARLAIINARLKGLKSGNADEDAEFEDTDALAAEAHQLTAEITARNKRIEEIMERRKWNIDNICKVTEEKTVVNAHQAASLKAEDFVPTGVTAAALEKSEAAKSSPTTNAALPSPPATASNSNSSPSTPATVTASSGPAKTASTKPPVVGPSEAAGSVSREKFQVISYNDYVLGQEQLLEQYSEIQDLEDTQKFLFKHCDVLLHEHAQSYMLLSCLEDEMNGKTQRMKLVCRQSQILSHITELGQSMRRDPRDVIIPFFRRIGEKEYYTQFVKAVDDFIARIKKRAIEKRKEMDRDRAREERGEVPLGPGGLDPYEVLESLPTVLRDAFDSQDINQLQAVLAQMDPKEAKRCMKRCVDSGLWVPSDNGVFEDEHDAAPAPMKAPAAASASDDIE